jgi:hypothetical protein
LLYPASLSVLPGLDRYTVLEKLREAGFDAAASRDGYVVVNLGNASITEFDALANVLKQVDIRWVILWNGVENGDENRARQVENVVKGFDGVLGAYSHGGLVEVTFSQRVLPESWHQLHMVFRLAGADIKLLVRFT